MLSGHDSNTEVQVHVQLVVQLKDAVADEQLEPLAKELTDVLRKYFPNSVVGANCVKVRSASIKHEGKPRVGFGTGIGIFDIEGASKRTLFADASE